MHAASPPPANRHPPRRRRRAASRVAGRASRLSQTFDFRMVERRRFRFTGGAPAATMPAWTPTPAHPAAARCAERDGFWLMSAGGVLLGTLGVFVEETGAAPLTAVWFRCAFGLLALLAWGAATRLSSARLRLRGRMLAAALAAGALVVFNWVSFFAAIGWTSIAVATVVVHVQPIWVMLIGAWWWRERISPRQARCRWRCSARRWPAACSTSGRVRSARLPARHRRCAGGLAHLRPRHAAGEGAQGVGSYAFASWQCGVGAVALAGGPGCTAGPRPGRPGAG